VLRLSGAERYDYLSRRAADWGSFYGIESDSGWALAGDEESDLLFPVWPHPKFVELCLQDEWSDCSIVTIPLSMWFDDLSEWLSSRDLKLSVVPLPTGSSVIVAPDRLGGDLQNELAKIED
jgi:hypothetical protein